MVSKETDKHIKLRANPDSGLGKCISYLQENPFNQQMLAAQTLEARFLPFVMDKNDPQFQGIAIQCAEQCLSWARAIQQYASLNMDLEVVDQQKIRERLSHPTQLVSVAMPIEEDDDESNDDLLLSEQEQRQAYGEDLMKSMML
ncbi:hypothetical protein [Crocosphaera sp. Alani8]|uniref:hypothetical protein n=1 Tax=Crocosphaera sp. Alani8 TaxID=3038952 RepID=UPI00313C48E9